MGQTSIYIMRCGVNYETRTCQSCYKQLSICWNPILLNEIVEKIKIKKDEPFVVDVNFQFYRNKIFVYR